MNKKALLRLVSRAITPVIAALLFAAPAQSASLSYFLDQSNALPDGTNYLRVTVADGADGAIDFTVEALPALLEIAGPNFGIQGFGFNVDDGLRVRSGNISGLPGGWTIRTGYRMSSFGVFDFRLFGTGNARTNTLTFSIFGINGDTPEDYVDLSRGAAGDGRQFFAAKVGGFDCENGARGCISSAYFGGGNAVPLPATAWLFLTGIAGVAMRARRRFATR
jgi:hypothetical protein